MGDVGVIADHEHAPMSYGVIFSWVDAVNWDMIEPIVVRLVSVASELGGMDDGAGGVAEKSD